jgi:hypothetical protein
MVSILREIKLFVFEKVKDLVKLEEKAGDFA